MTTRRVDAPAATEDVVADPFEAFQGALKSTDESSDHRTSVTCDVMRRRRTHARPRGRGNAEAEVEANPHNASKDVMLSQTGQVCLNSVKKNNLRSRNSMEERNQKLED